MQHVGKAQHTMTTARDECARRVEEMERDALMVVQAEDTVAVSKMLVGAAMERMKVVTTEEEAVAAMRAMESEHQTLLAAEQHLNEMKETRVKNMSVLFEAEVDELMSLSKEALVKMVRELQKAEPVKVRHDASKQKEGESDAAYLKRTRNLENRRKKREDSKRARVGSIV